MKLERYLFPIFQTLSALVLILLTVGYSYHTINPSTLESTPPSIIEGIHVILKFVIATIGGHELRAQFYGITGVEIWDSLRLVIVSFMIAIAFGLAFTFIRSHIRLKKPSSVVDVLMAILESIPEPVFVIALVLLVLTFLSQFKIVLSLFPDGPPNFMDTLVPGITLGIPAALYLQRILYIQMRDQMSMDYVLTAVSKGASPRRVFYLHVLPNLFPYLFKQFGVIASIILSSILFTEYFTDYQGLYFYINDAIGTALGKPAGIPQYQIGYTFILGAILVLLAVMLRILGIALVDITHLNDVVPGSSRSHRKVQVTWIVIGMCLLSSIFFFSLFPHLITNYSPNQVQYGNYATGQSAPFPPSRQHPFGTNVMGQDMLALVLSSTLTSLLPAIAITILVTIGSSCIALLSEAIQNRYVRKVSEWVGNVTSAVPVLFILLVVMSSRNFHSPYQELQYVMWIVVLEVVRSVPTFQHSIDEWLQFPFVEGAYSIGLTKSCIIFRHLQSWFGQFTLEFILTEFARVLSLMTVLAAFHVYTIEKAGYQPMDALAPTKLTIISAQTSWFQMIGDVSGNMAFISFPFYLYGPLLALLLTTVSVNLIARGIRGK